MRQLLLLLTIFGLFTSGLFAQAEDADTQLLVSNTTSSYPKYIDTGNNNYDRLIFRKAVLKFAEKHRDYPIVENATNPNREIESWNKENPAIAEDLVIYSYDDYKLFMEIANNPVLNYAPIPKKVNTGDLQADELKNKANLTYWMEHHPEYPPYSDDMEALRIARLAFYDKYIKPQEEK